MSDAKVGLHPVNFGSKARAPAPWLFRLAARLFGGTPVDESVVTTLPFAAPPHQVWDSLLTYEEVRHRPNLLLRLLLPQPLGTAGDKTRPGENVPCTYQHGSLIKRITHVQPPGLLRFDVVNQNLGIENCINACGGSYRILRAASHSTVELTTNYQTRLHPRTLWRPVEHALAHQFHRHILKGMQTTLHPGAKTK